MSKIEIHKNDITNLKVDAVVNAANSELRQGGGVCGAIFRAAGEKELTLACRKIGGCPTGNAVITPAFGLIHNRFIIHAVGPVYTGGSHGEAQALYNCYNNSLKLAMVNGCHSVGFPLISSGIFGYPLDEAWEIALRACMGFIDANRDYYLDIVFVGTDRSRLNVGLKTLERLQLEQEGK